MAYVRTGLPFRSTEVGRLWRARARENSLGHYCKVRGSPLAIYQAAGGTERYTTKRKKKKRNHRSVQCNLLWLLQQLSAITILRSGSIWLFNTKALRSVGNKHEPSMRQSLLLPRLTQNWLHSWGWPWTSIPLSPLPTCWGYRHVPLRLVLPCGGEWSQDFIYARQAHP